MPVVKQSHSTQPTAKDATNGTLANALTACNAATISTHRGASAILKSNHVHDRPRAAFLLFAVIGFIV